MNDGFLLGQLSTKLDMVHEAVKEGFKRTNGLLGDHDERISKIETGQQVEKGKALGKRQVIAYVVAAGLGGGSIGKLLDFLGGVLQ